MDENERTRGWRWWRDWLGTVSSVIKLPSSFLFVPPYRRVCAAVALSGASPDPR